MRRRKTWMRRRTTRRSTSSFVSRSAHVYPRAETREDHPLPPHTREFVLELREMYLERALE